MSGLPTPEHSRPLALPEGQSDQTSLQPRSITKKVRMMLGEGPLAAYPLMRLSLMAERAKRIITGGEHKFARSMFSLKICEDLLKLDPETENVHDLLAGASGVWSHEAVFEESLSESFLQFQVIRLIFQLEKQQQARLQQLKMAFQQMQTQPESSGEIPLHLKFEDRFSMLTPEKWVNLLGRYNTKPVDLCLLPEKQELRPRTLEELQTIRVIFRDKEGRVRSLYHHFSESDSAVSTLASQVLELWKSPGDIGEPVEHPFFEIEVDLTDASQGSESATDLLIPHLGAREAIANRASVCHCKLDHQRVGFYYPHFSNNEDQGWQLANKLLQTMQARLRPVDPSTKVIDTRMQKTEEGEKLAELELVAGFTFLPEETAWHASALKLFESPGDSNHTPKTKPSFVQLVGMAQGFLTESTTYLCVAAKKAELQLALLPFVGDESRIIQLLEKLRSMPRIQEAHPDSLLQLTLEDISKVIEEMKKVTAFTNQDITDCQAGHGLVAQLYVSTNEASKTLFSQLFPSMHGKLQKGPAQISSIFHNSNWPVVFTTAVDQHASIGIAVANTVSGEKKSRQLTFRLRLEQEEIAELRDKYSQESDITAAALREVEQQAQELRRTMIDLSLILSLAHAQSDTQQQALVATYLKLIALIQPQPSSSAETLISRSRATASQDSSRAEEGAIPHSETLPESKETALVVLPPVETALIVHPTLGK